MCAAPKPREGFGFTFQGDTLPGYVDMTCQVDGGTSGGGVTSATIALTCTDDAAVAHAVSIDLRAYEDLELAFVAALPQVRLVHVRADSFEYYELVALRGLDDSLLLFAGSGYNMIAPEFAPLWAPLSVAQVDEGLCATEMVADCETRRRGALDITRAGVSERVLDQDWADLGEGFAAHVGVARVVDLYPNDQCGPGDGVDGFEVNFLLVNQG